MEADRRQGASEVENYGRGPWQEGLRNSTLYVTLVALQYKCILARGSAFVDDTNILTVSPSVAVNCRRLEEAHNKCLAWARKHGVKFAPNKYQLIHFTRRCHKPSLDHPIHIQGFNGKPYDGLRVLGVWVNKGLTYRKHAQRAAEKAMLRLNCTLRIA